MTTDADTPVESYVAAHLDLGANCDGGTVEADGTRREQQAVILIKQRLHQQFPNVPPDRIHTTVQEHYHRFDCSRIRDFIPIFVERGARAQLAAEVGEV